MDCDGCDAPAPGPHTIAPCSEPDGTHAGACLSLAVEASLRGKGCALSPRPSLQGFPRSVAGAPIHGGSRRQAKPALESPSHSQPVSVPSFIHPLGALRPQPLLRVAPVLFPWRQRCCRVERGRHRPAALAPAAGDPAPGRPGHAAGREARHPALGVHRTREGRPAVLVRELPARGRLQPAVADRRTADSSTPRRFASASAMG
jgi:hypothetical protein